MERAVELGFSHYGLSEHCPRYRREDLFEDEADLDPQDTVRIFGEYATEAKSLREEFAGRIELLVGFETERLPPDSWQQKMAALRDGIGLEYTVGSVHSIEGQYIDYSPELTARVAERCGGVEPMQRRYFDAVADLVQRLSPEIVGHIDLIRKFHGPGAALGASVMRSVETTLEVVRAQGGVLDVNCGAHRRGLSPVYPLPDILARACEMGIGATLGDDGHGAHDVGVGLDASLRAIADAGYKRVHYLTRVGSDVVWRTAALEDVKP